MTAELRSEYHRHLDRLGIALGALLGVIPDAVERANESVLSGETGLRFDLDRWQAMVLSISDDVDHTAEATIALQSPLAGELRFLMGCVRLVGILSDTIDLIAELGTSAALAWDMTLPDRVRPLLGAIGREAAGAWRTVSDMWDGKPEATLTVLRAQDDRLTETRTGLAAELGGLANEAAAVAQLTGVAYGYERIIRHAVTAGRLVKDIGHPGPYGPDGGAHEALGEADASGEEEASGEADASGEEGAGGSEAPPLT